MGMEGSWSHPGKTHGRREEGGGLDAGTEESVFCRGHWAAPAAAVGIEKERHKV